MKVRKIVVFILTFFLVLSVFSQSGNAASTKTGYVSLSSGTLNARSGPETNYTVVGSLQNNSHVTVYTQTKSGWSEIRYNSKKAFVATKYLRFYSYKPESEYYTDLQYPLSIGKKWTESGMTSRIIDMNKKLTTKAGMFRGVVTVKTSDGFTSYYAQNIGFIKSVKNGKTISELTKLDKK